METGGGEKRFHAQISWLMFVFSIFVIWVHSYNVDLFSCGAQDSIWILADQIENFVSVGLGQIAVPGFFLLSSYLFFRNFSWDKLPGKWKSREFSVLVPYVVWNIIYYLGYMAASRLLAMQSVVGRDVIPFTVQEIWRAISRYAYAPIFWYLYQLIFLIIASPVIYALVKNRAVGLFWIIALVFAVHLHLDMRHPNTDALLYYSVAAYFAVHRRGLVERSMVEEAMRNRCMAESVAGVIISVFCYRRMMTPGRRCSLDLLLPDGCPDDMLGVCLRNPPSKSPPLDAPEYVPVCDPFCRCTVCKQRCGTSDRSCFRNAGSRRNCAVYLFSASGDRCLCTLRAGEIPCKVCTGSVENLVGWKEAGRMSVGRESVYAGQNHTSKNYMLIFGKNANSFFIGNPLYYL